MTVPTRRLLDSKGVDVVGDVTASPTSNTILARLKSLLTDIVLKAGTAIIGKVGIDQTTDGTTNAVHLVAGTALAGKVGIDQTTPGTTNGVVRVGGGLSSSGVLSGDTQVKSSAGKMYMLSVSDTAALTLTVEDAVGTGTAKWGMDLPAAGYAHFIFDPPYEFATGIYLNVNTATCKVTIGYI